MSRHGRGRGDEGAAVDLLPLAEVDLDPPVDSGQLADLLIAAKEASDPAVAAKYVAEAKRLAGTSPSALALIKMTTDRLAAPGR